MTFSVVDSEPILDLVNEARGLAIQRQWEAWDARHMEQRDYWLGYASALGMIEDKIRSGAVRWEDKR